MRPNPLPALLLLCLCSLAAPPARSAETDITADGLLPPGIAGDLARDLGVPRPGEGPFPYVIVTGRALRTEFLALARERIRNGIPSRVRSLESLQSEYPTAVDDAERVRLFLRDAHEHWRTRWVLLGGDTDILPPRYATLRGVLPERNIVSDWYYACLDGTWDADGDGLYGESPGQGEAGDSPDMEPELFLGRAPVSDHLEARAFVRKTLAYERRQTDAFEHTTLLFAHRLVISPPFGVIDFAQYAERLLPRITDDPVQQVTRLYESWEDPLWVPGALPETRGTVIEALNQGHNVVVGYGVGNPGLLGVGTQEYPDPQRLTVADVLGLTNGDRAGHVWLFTSLVNAFDQPTSLAEAFLRAPEGGAVTVIAPSDFIFIGQGEELARRFVEVVFDEGAATISEALVRTLAHLVSPTGGTHMAMAYQLLGDPLLRVFSQSPVASAGDGSDRGLVGITGLARPRNDGPGMEVLTVLGPREAPPPAATAGSRRESPILALSLPVPSPAVASVRVECSMPRAAVGVALDVAIVDLAGRVVRRLGPSLGPRGSATVTWDLRDSDGRRVSPGVFFMRVRAAGSSRTARLVVAAGP